VPGTQFYRTSLCHCPNVITSIAENRPDARSNEGRENLQQETHDLSHSGGWLKNADSMLIWTRAMNSIVLHEAFVAQDCASAQAPQPAVTIEAGANLGDKRQGQPVGAVAG